MNKIISEKFTQTNSIERGEYVECEFKDCDLNGMNLSYYSFIECEFINCNLSNIKFEHTSLKDVLFKSCKLMGIHFELVNPFLLKLKFEESNLNYSSFFRLKIPKTKFNKSSIQEVDFTEANLKESVFNECDLTLSKFEDSNLEKVDFYTSIGYSFNPSKNNIKKARFSKNEVAGLLSDFDIIISE